MPVEFIETEIPAVLEVRPRVFRDGRGFFMEAHSERNWAQGGFDERFVQDNVSCSAKGVLRGMHYQLDPHGMGKYVRVLRGAVFDVALDLRRGSPTFGRWAGRELTAENALGLWVPVGFAHGFQALEDDTLVYYKCTGLYTPDAERSVNAYDAQAAITWPLKEATLSEKDAVAPSLADAEYNFAYSAPGA